MLAALAARAELFAGDGRHTRPSIDDECLGLAVCPEIHRDVIVHEVGRVTVERSGVQVHVFDFSQAIVGQATLVSECTYTDKQSQEGAY